MLGLAEKERCDLEAGVLPRKERLRKAKPTSAVPPSHWGVVPIVYAPAFPALGGCDWRGPRGLFPLHPIHEPRSKVH